MKRIILLVPFFFFLTTIFCQSTLPERQLKTINLSGNGYERGFQHGQQLKQEIAELMVLWKKSLEKNMNYPADSFIQNFLSATNFIPAIKKYTPDIYDEVRGIANGSGQPFGDIFAFQLPDEYWVYQNRISNDTTYHHCSAMGIPAMNGRPAYVSQNMDLESWMDGYQVLMHIEANGKTPEQYILSCAGLIALNGLNKQGIGVCVNTLMQLNACEDGLPVAFMIRGVLSKKKGKDALHFLKTTKHATGQNYILGVVDSVYDYEASANKVVRLYPDASGIVYHTNHPLVNDDVKPWYKDYYQDYLAGKTQHNNSEVRIATLKKRASQSKEKNDTFLMATLRSKDDPKNVVCRPNIPSKSFFTFGSTILTLSDKPNLQITAGPPDESAYKTFVFGK